MKKYVIAACLLPGLRRRRLPPSIYVAQNTSNHKCSIVSHEARRQVS